MEEKDIKIIDPVKKNIAILKRLKVAYILAKENDYVPGAAGSLSVSEEISKSFYMFENTILEDYQGLRPDEVIDRMIKVIDKF